MGARGTVSYIKGLFAATVKWPLGFSPKTGYADPTGVVQILGAGASDNPEISSADGARFIELNLKTTSAGSAAVAGIHMNLSSTSATAVFTGLRISASGTGAITGIGMDGAFTSDMISLQPSSLATGKRALRIGLYGTEIPVAGGEGLIRTYSKVISGTDAVALEFHWGYVTTAAVLIGSQRQYEVQSGTPGPNAIFNMDLLTSVDSLKYLASGGDGMIGLRSKMWSNNGTNINGNVFAFWADHQINVAGPNAIEASIRGTTGGSKPDAFVYLETTSSGWSQFLQLAASMAAKEPFVATGCSVTVASVPYLKVLVNTTQYGIPLIAI